MEKKLTVIETAELLGVSKEAIYNRIRRGSLDSVIENGVKYVILTEDIKKTSRTKKINNMVNDAYIQLLKDELQELKEKVKNLEADKDRLTKEKEELLIESTAKMEQIYKQRDEQLKSILALASRPALEKKEPVYENATNDKVEEDIDTIEIEVDKDKNDADEILDSYDNWQDLRDYLKNKGYSKKEKKVIKEEISKKVGLDDSVKYSNGKIFIKKIKKNMQLKDMLSWS
ncbi:helix-turn-helix domain-containing protein [Sulfurospirillum sp. 1612]|uniref:helix-turn-helix domain-containing protein n=1 Tax=Sulfurospirillum sp. 1612 TaxID=3094835 RepID=UPI002F94B949